MRRTGRGRGRATRPSRGASTSLCRPGRRLHENLRGHGDAHGFPGRPRAEGISDAGIANNTIVIFTSDNGGERFADTWPFTGKKTELLEGGLRIPA